MGELVDFEMPQVGQLLQHEHMDPNSIMKKQYMYAFFEDTVLTMSIRMLHSLYLASSWYSSQSVANQMFLHSGEYRALGV